MKGFRTDLEDGLLRLTLDNPPVNVLTIAVLDGLSETLEGAADTRAVILAAEGRTFSAGMDIGEHVPEQAPEMLRAAHRFFRALWGLPCPLIAEVRGGAFGGAFEALLLCDVVLAAESARFSLPEVTVGAFPPLASVLLPARLPWPLAYDLVGGARVLTAEEAQSCGLVTAVFPVDDFARGADACRRGLLARSAAVARVAKRSLRLGLGGDEVFARLSAAERLYRDDLLPLSDAREGLAAFREKRAPDWTHA